MLNLEFKKLKIHIPRAYDLVLSKGSIINKSNTNKISILDITQQVSVKNDISKTTTKEISTFIKKSFKEKNLLANNELFFVNNTQVKESSYNKNKSNNSIQNNNKNIPYIKCFIENVYILNNVQFEKASLQLRSQLKNLVLESIYLNNLLL